VSNLEPDPQETRCGGRIGIATAPVRELLPGAAVALGGPRAMNVTRTLPSRSRRMVGAWCFLDYYGPDDITAGPGMRVPPHPHTGIQTVTWLIAGEVLHRDSLGSRQLVQPGELNLMTAGRAISHAEQTPPDHSAILHGVQLWTALPDRYRHADPHFEHHPDLPVLRDGAVTVTVIMGELAGVSSPARTYSPLVGAQATLDGGTGIRLPLVPEFEYAALAVSGTVEVDGVPLAPGPLLYLGTGRADLALRAVPPSSGRLTSGSAPLRPRAAGVPPSSAEQPGRILLLGGEPFEEEIVMWWNFVERSHEEIVADREEWMTGKRFGSVRGYDGDPLPAPSMPTTRLKPRGRQPS
jgi:quercetin 2,3-dioxygenase